MNPTVLDKTPASPSVRQVWLLANEMNGRAYRGSVQSKRHGPRSALGPWRFEPSHVDAARGDPLRPLLAGLPRTDLVRQ